MTRDDVERIIENAMQNLELEVSDVTDQFTISSTKRVTLLYNGRVISSCYIDVSGNS